MINVLIDLILEKLGFTGNKITKVVRFNILKIKNAHNYFLN